MMRWILLAMWFITVSAYPDEGSWLTLRGKAQVAIEPLSDPAPGGKPVAYLSVQGVAAKAMYGSMQGYRFVANACGESGLSSRTVGDVVCYQKKAVYSCEFGVRLSDGAIRAGRAC
jgi:hypothetical protein